ncbi:MAG TPA: CRTAC1 family protein, partial [Bryobacteraceae bacterium]|nr:CRTAC1 family protein [Bryobacteraceae bacterium]
GYHDQCTEAGTLHNQSLKHIPKRKLNLARRRGTAEDAKRRRVEDVAATAGLTAPSLQGHPRNKKYIVEANGTGVAFVDFDNDGWLDVFLVNGGAWEPEAAATSHLYRNTGKGTFEDTTKPAGVARSGWGSGVCLGDYDNDGFTDLYVTYWGPNSLYRNNGRGGFADTAAAARVAGPADEWSTGCTFVDYDRDGLLDLLVTSYVQFDRKSVPLPGQAPHCIYRDQPVFCGPRGLPHGTMTLYRNAGAGRFVDVSESSGIRSGPPCYAFTALAADLSADGWPDLYIACDSTPSLYFRNGQDGTFTELGAEASLAYNEHGTEQAGMGIAAADVNGDGLPDITKTNFVRDYPNLYINAGRGAFEDHAVRAGLGVRPNYVLWGTGLEDFDNDGLRDLFQVSGHVFTNITGEPWAGPRILFRNLGEGRFEDVSSQGGAGIAAQHSSRGAAFGDFDNDGDVDVLIMNMGGPPSLLRNDLKPARNWVQFNVQGTTSNRSAIGATVTVVAGNRRQTAVVTSQSSYLSSNGLRLHFGLGEAQVDEVLLRWPSGATQSFRGVKSNRVTTLVEQ